MSTTLLTEKSNHCLFKLPNTGVFSLCSYHKLQSSDIIILLLQRSLRYLVHTRILKVQNKQAHRPRCEITQHPVQREINLAHGNRKHADKVLDVIAELMRKPLQVADTRICLADTCEQGTVTNMYSNPRQTFLATPHPCNKSARHISKTTNIYQTIPTSRDKQLSCLVANNHTMTNSNHSIDNLEQVHESTDLDRCRIDKKRNECQYDPERRCSVPRAFERFIMHNKEDVYEEESIRKRNDVDEYGGRRQAATLKFKYIQDRGAQWMKAIGRTMDVRGRALALMVLILLNTLATCAAAPTNSRSTRSAHSEKATVSVFYLRYFFTYVNKTRKRNYYCKEIKRNKTKGRLFKYHVPSHVSFVLK